MPRLPRVTPEERKVASIFAALLMDVGAFYRTAIPRYGLSLGQYTGLRYIAANEPVRISALARCVTISRPTATAFVDRMERKGWVLRIRSEEDRRVIGLRLTPKASRLLWTLETEHAEFLARALARLPRGRRREVVTWLGEVDRALRAERAAHGMAPARGPG
jgi:DNA-binding MarR family transcriptional regulator